MSAPRRPVILIACAERGVRAIRSDGLSLNTARYSLGQAYVEGLRAAGALPLIAADLSSDIEQAAELADGIMLPGGPDMDPSSYGAARDPRTSLADAQTDHFQIALLRACEERGLPVLGICRGLQALNVARGGTLHQHLPALHGGVVHLPDDWVSNIRHRVRIAPGSKLYELGGKHDELTVNSHHHQGIDRLGEGLRPVGWAMDGLIEAIEGTGDRFVLAVQWHPETIRDWQGQQAIFDLFVAAAIESRRRRESA